MVKKLSEKTRRKISESMKGRTLSKEHKKKISDAIKGKNNPFYGRHHSLETKRKLSESHKNPSLETRRKMSESHTGVKRPVRICQRMSRAQKRRYENPEEHRRTSNALKGNTHTLGRKHTFESRKKMSDSTKKCWQNPEYGRKVFARISPTDIERKIRMLLVRNSLSFKMQKPIGSYRVDFFLRPNYIIEADGEFWHGSFRMKVHGKERDSVLKSKGYQILHLPGKLISQNINLCESLILGFVKAG